MKWGGLGGTIVRLAEGRAAAGQVLAARVA
jgi:hypothetical protein